MSVGAVLCSCSGCYSELEKIETLNAGADAYPSIAGPLGRTHASAPVDFYLDYLSANDAGLFLPTSIKSYVDGRLGQMEDRMSSLLYKQAAEQDMVASILADTYQFSEEDLKRRRAESVKNVKRTNGRIALDQRVREVWEEGDEWQD